MQCKAVIHVPYITTSAVSQQSTSVMKWWILLQSHRVRHSRPLPFKLMKTNRACHPDREREIWKPEYIIAEHGGIYNDHPGTDDHVF